MRRTVVVLGLLAHALSGLGCGAPLPPSAAEVIQQSLPRASALQDLPVTFRYDGFPDVSSLQLNGVAAQRGSRLLLADAVAGGQAGSVFRTASSTLGADRSFSTYLQMQMTDGGGNSTQADGLVFVLQGQGSTALGPSGLWLAYSGITPSLGVEFDSYDNPQLGDPDDHHVGTHLNGDMTSHVATASSPTSWANGSEYNLWIDYDGNSQTLEVRTAQNSAVRPSAPLLSQQIDLSGLPAQLFAGFTAATQDAWARHWVDSWYFQDHYAPIDLAASGYREAPASVLLTATPASSAHVSQLTARLVDANGLPQAGWSVTFSTSLGVLSADAVTTDASGVATVTLTATNTSGTAHVVASAGSVSGSVDVGLLPNPAVIASAAGPGSVSPVGTVYVPLDGSQTFTFQAQPGNAVSEVQVDGASVGAVDDYTFQDIVTDHRLTVDFVFAPYHLSPSVRGQGAVSPPGDTLVGLGGSKRFQFTPASGHRLYQVLVDGQSVGAPGEYTFSQVNASHSVEATFVPLQYGISCSAAPFQGAEAVSLAAIASAVWASGRRRRSRREPAPPSHR